MKSKNAIRIGMAQINTTVGDLRGNTEKIEYYISSAKKSGVDILSFPELTVTGYPPEDLLFDKQFIKDNKSCLDKIVDNTNGITVIVGFVDGEDNIYNGAALICNKKIAGIYRKTLLPNYGVFDEKRYFKPGNSIPVFYFENTPFSINICEDIWFADGIIKKQVDIGNASIIFNISSSPYYAGRLLERKKMLSMRALENNIYISYNNLVGGQDELIFDGGGMILNNRGKIIAMGKQFEEDLIIEDIEKESLKQAKFKTTSYFYKKNEIINIKLTGKTENNKKNTIKIKKKPFVNIPSSKEKLLSEIYSAIVTGTKDYVNKNGFKGVVIGLSGGIDSALTAVTAVDALSKNNVTGIAMPSIYTSKESIDDAKTLALNLGIKLKTIPINPIVMAYKKTLAEIFGGMGEDITEENIQARIRGNLLMALSNKFGWLVLTTGNKSEMSVGYCTLYGDMAGGFAVIKDVPKTMVYSLSNYRNSLSKFPVIPKSIIEKAPTAELKPGQKDEDSLPPYSVLDSILQSYIEENKNVKEIENLGYNKKQIKEILSLVDKSEYKRRQAPPGIKITPRAFGKDRRFPITNKNRSY